MSRQLIMTEKHEQGTQKETEEKTTKGTHGKLPCLVSSSIVHFSSRAFNIFFGNPGAFGSCISSFHPETRLFRQAQEHDAGAVSGSRHKLNFRFILQFDIWGQFISQLCYLKKFCGLFVIGNAVFLPNYIFRSQNLIKSTV